MWELALRYFSPALDREKTADKKLTYFPIYDDKHRCTTYLAVAGRRGMPVAVLDDINAVQPFNSGYESLSWLHRLVNTDKHRMPILTLAFIPTVTFIADLEGNVESYGSGKLKVHDEASDELVDWQPGMKGAPVWNDQLVVVTFEDTAVPRDQVDQTLKQMVTTVTGIVNRFDRHL